MKNRSQLCIFFLIAVSGNLGAEHRTETSAHDDVVTARVFIHGTLMLGGVFWIDLQESWNDAYKENSRIERTIASARRHPFLHHSEVVLDLGMVDITSDIMVPLSHKLVDEKAAISIIRAFERTDRCVRNRKGAYHYYTFGWSGALSERKRNRESGYLYEELLIIKNNLTAQYPQARIRFELYAHSHGGQLIAHLATINKQSHKNELFIDLAVLSATPLYKEKMQPMISSSMFGTIVHLYSLGDSVQNLDFISTPQRYCVRSLQELAIPLPRAGTTGPKVDGPKVFDVCVSAYNNKQVFSHESFFCCTTYPLASYYRKRADIKKTLKMFAPLPILVLYPACINSIESLKVAPGFHSLTINLERKNNTLLALSTYYKKYHAEFAALHDTRYYRIKPLSSAFIKEYDHRARTSKINQLTYTFYHIMNS